jgi:hypothetical protein
MTKILATNITTKIDRQSSPIVLGLAELRRYRRTKGSVVVCQTRAMKIPDRGTTAETARRGSNEGKWNLAIYWLCAGFEGAAGGNC